MEKRIKIIHWLTIIGMVALVVIQGYWLLNQYKYTLSQYEEELFQKVIHVGEADKALRKKLQDQRYAPITQWKMNTIFADSTTFNPLVEWLFDTYIVDKHKFKNKNTTSFQKLDSLSDINDGTVRKFRFNIKVPNHEYDVYHALEMFHINVLCPFTIERFDSILQVQDIKVLDLKTEFTNSLIWKPIRISHHSIWNPKLEVIYPFNILQKEQVRIICQPKISPILKRMIESLLCSVALSLLLIFCLIYQGRTILKQQRIDELRKGFARTMIHELKRPVTALKLCISFMKNEKMMQDQQAKEEVLHNSYNELENLSSYFSKLRDMTIEDMEKIPLNLSTFNLYQLIRECIEKQNYQTGKQVSFKTEFDNNDLKITADRMHISNIICNLLENSIKYSGSTVTITIVCQPAVNGMYCIEISDNGFGIPENEKKYIFDKFFRSKSIIDKDIPGIGLGLSYVRLLVSAHKGSIQLKSKLGTGSSFIIKLPQRQ